MKITKENLTKLRAELNQVLAKYGSEKELEFELGSISFSETSFSVKLSAKTTEKISGKPAAQIEFERDCFLFNLKASDFGRKISVYGEEYIITGVNPRSRKAGVIAKKLSDGREYRMNSSLVK